MHSTLPIEIDPSLDVDHELKTWTTPFGDVLAGRKRHEVRTTRDRQFRVGHRLLLREWDRQYDRATGRTAIVEVTAITKPGTFGLGPHVCVMSIDLVHTAGPPPQP